MIVITLECVAKVCCYQGINPSNKSDVSVCSKCGNFEHFVCVRITNEHKEAITLGKMKYFCSLCFSKDPIWNIWNKWVRALGIFACRMDLSLDSSRAQGTVK